jgi:HEPN domain-containing protein
MNRADFQRLDQLRIREGKVLLDKGHHAGAYYLLGYAVECAIKACIAKKTREHDFPDKQRGIKSWDHDLTKLLGVAELEQELDTEMKKSKKFASNWSTVKDWKVDTRYEHNISAVDAKDLFSAVTAWKYGVLSWLKKWW